MASGKTLNAANLQALGAAQLAELLIEISKGNAAAQRRLRLALAGSGGAAEAARAIIKRVGSIARARTWLDWQKIKPFVGLCCIDLPAGNGRSISPFDLRLGDADVLRPPELKHPVHCVHGNGDLGRSTPIGVGS